MKRKPISAFSLSFLDCMCCGFGAVILVFMIISNRISTQAEVITEVRKLEVVRLGAQVDQQAELLSDRESKLEEAADELAAIADELRRRNSQIGQASAEVASARAYSKEQAEEIKRAQQRRSIAKPPKTHVRKVLNRGNRQYLTGLRMGGKRVLILIDSSTSMLDRTIVNVLIRRNMSPAAQRKAPKWAQVVSTVDWLTANLDPDADFQIYTFDTEARPLLEDTRGKWLAVADGKPLDKAMKALREVTPSGGTSLWAAFRVIETMTPKPDNVYLLADGLPTVGAKAAKRATVSGDERLRHFHRAVDRLPRAVPINIILYPFEGDPEAASAYWALSIRSRGSFLSPSEHWP
jgi:hypothetical protein